MAETIFRRVPLAHEDGIPVFSDRDAYVRNYEKISEDHLASLAQGNDSPFMTNEQIRDSEVRTTAVVKKFVKNGAKILDAGVGLGGLLKSMPEFERYGVDVSLPYLKHVKAHGINVAMSKLEELPYNDNSFDAVVCCDVLEHVFKLDLVVEELMRVLKQDGVLIVRVPNNELLDSYLTGLQDYSHSHVRGFNLVSLRLYLEKCHSLRYLTHEHCGFIFSTSAQIKHKLPSMKSQLGPILQNYMRQEWRLRSNPDMLSMKKLLTSSFEETTDALINIREKHPRLFSEMFLEVLEPIELIGVFAK